MHPLAPWWAATAADLAVERRVLRDYAAALTFTIGWWHWLMTTKPIRRDRLTLRIDARVSTVRRLCAPAVPLDPRLAEIDREAARFLDSTDTATHEHEDVVRVREPLRRLLDLLDDIEDEMLRRPPAERR
ncbi:hypothetical protein [Catenuloplanes indicus]|uniref:Uncharacterized protein n=1 Tax=Catenuloplanes indicus TaxID=137267 RepID=A0AAE3VX33_9ACTN|nr:hypothetical protein [Catenuloplanes indicus]MDQ0365306.1 hypothetical protein [Catenuloplanes indicus]